MENFSSETIQTLKNTSLFRGNLDTEIDAMLICLEARESTFDKNTFVYRQGDKVNSLGVILKGSVQIIEEDFWGNRNIISKVGVGQLFAESYVCVQDESLRISVLATEKTSVLLLDIKKVLRTCSSACEFHSRLIQNLLTVIARKNIHVTEKVQFLSQRTTKDKLMAYLSSESHRQGAMSFDIPFNRQELSDFLAVDRSALSKELGKLRDEGILDYKKNHFTLR